ncbi:MAG: dihydrolipoamide acetyltransferase family protein [Candidatus Bathyarchaeota archaeon]|jgi:pyruvate dehydrogenase E2 component (dihydrolipoamide acetyltransferase)
MVTKVVMPRLGLTMKEGTVGIWYKKEGDTIKKGDPLVEVFSEKATYDLEAPASGILKKIVIQEGIEAPVNAVIAFITAPEEDITEEEFSKVRKEIEDVEKKILASPAAKRLAEEYGVDLSTVEGSGPEGRIVQEDIRKFVEKAEGILPKVKEVIPLRGYRKTSAERVLQSYRTAPHSTVFMKADISKARALRDKLHVSYTTILVKAAAKSLIEYPLINSALEKDQIRIFQDVNIGVAMATTKGLVVPVVHNADKKSMEQIDTEIKNLAEDAKKGKLSKDKLTGGTFTITNLGMYGVEFFIPIINPPEAAILAVGKVIEKPVVVKDGIATKPVMMLSLSYDHRIVDGAPASEFLGKVKEKIEDATRLIEQEA